eukprot:TRINITY_DN5027_c0_g1_i1.p2 TRINITY_DN5027_c0_g1~~TRINITY_DN5027_c0_g1_i1.p2  ORF type:complete len:139 (+),score=27.03 TRINITY_DN5027_c0_g1_i1:185-601(+)
MCIRDSLELTKLYKLVSQNLLKEQDNQCKSQIQNQARLQVFQQMQTNEKILKEQEKKITEYNHSQSQDEAQNMKDNLYQSNILAENNINSVITDSQQTIPGFRSVSYTHLTLPTICSVQISVVAVSLKKKKKYRAKSE